MKNKPFEERYHPAWLAIFLFVAAAIVETGIIPLFFESLL